jgi:hypothetical protein
MRSSNPTRICVPCCIATRCRSCSSLMQMHTQRSSLFPPSNITEDVYSLCHLPLASVASNTELSVSIQCRRCMYHSIEQCPPTSKSSLFIFSLRRLLHPVSSSTLRPSCFPHIFFSKFHSPAGSDSDANTPMERPIRHVPLCTSSHNVHPPTMNLIPV